MGCGASKVLPNQPPKKSQEQDLKDRQEKKKAEQTKKQTQKEPITINTTIDTNGKIGELNLFTTGASPNKGVSQFKKQAIQNEEVIQGGSNNNDSKEIEQHSPIQPKKPMNLLLLTKKESNPNFTQILMSPVKLLDNSITIKKGAAFLPRGSIDTQELLGNKIIPNQFINDTFSSVGNLQMASSLPRGSQFLPRDSELLTRGSETIKGPDPILRGSDLIASPQLERAASIHANNIERKNKEKIPGNGRVYQSGTSEDKTEFYTRQQKKPTGEDYDFILTGLKNNSVFYQLSEDQIKEIVNIMFLCHTPKDQYLFKQGDKACAFFIIKTGRIAIEIDSSEKKELGPGTGIGELALLYSAPRSASIKCKTDCEFWAIDRITFKKTVEEIIQRDSQTNRKFMESVPFFNFMSDEQKDSIAAALISVRFKAGDNIVCEGDRADSFYLIKEGKVSIWRNGQMIRNLFQSDSFGEQALYVKSTRAATVKADEEVKLLSLGRDDLTRIIGGKIQKIVYANKQRWAYNNNQLLLKLTNIQIEKILMNTKISNFKAGTVLYEKGDYCDTLIAVLDGNLKGENSGKIVADKGNIFGDDYLPLQNQNTQFNEKIVIASDAVLSTISFKQFHKCIGGDISTVIQKNADSHEVKMKRENQKEDFSFIKLEDLIVIKKLGVGQFGSVFLVRRKNTKELYALKSVSKGQITEQNLEKHLISEKKVLEMIHFPFIMNFIKTFKDNQSVYFLLKFISGMELFDVIRDIGLLSTFDSQFYIGSLILSLEYLHSRCIIYRDIKPENLMVDNTGYMYVIDMGAAKILSKSKSVGRTFTIIGTPHYMAPEIIKGKGYSYNSDLWSVGVCLFEFMCGTMPYAEEAQDPYEIYEEIMSKDLHFPSFLKDRKARLFIEQLLQKQPELRLGGSYAALKTNSWFDNFEWDSLFNKQIAPPYIPPVAKLISQDYVDRKYKEGKLVMHKIKQEQDQNPIKYNKGMSKDPDWEKEF